ncbi:MAG: serine protease [Candidatus Coproplasma sp.]
MEIKDKIATYYSNARELVKQNNPKAARAYVLAILNYAVKTYETASTILLKARTKAFLDKWLAVSRELYDKGVTDYVLECFGLPTMLEQQLPKVEKQPPAPAAKKPVEYAKPVLAEGEIDIAGLIDESAKEQGWSAVIFEKAKSAVVEIVAENSAVRSTATGFIISSRGYLLTNDHVVFDEQTQGYYPKAKMTFIGGKKSYKINVLFSDKKADVALCSFNPEEVGDFAVIRRIPDYSKVLQGGDCLVIGNAFGKGLSPLTGTIRFTKSDEGDLVYTAPANSGDSGAPVLNRQGDCIGIHKSRTISVDNVAAEGFANATPMDRIDALIKKWCDSNGIIL